MRRLAYILVLIAIGTLLGTAAKLIRNMIVRPTYHHHAGR